MVYIQVLMMCLFEAAIKTVFGFVVKTLVQKCKIVQGVAFKIIKLMSTSGRSGSYKTWPLLLFNGSRSISYV